VPDIEGVGLGVFCQKRDITAREIGLPRPQSNRACGFGQDIGQRQIVIERHRILNRLVDLVESLLRIALYPEGARQDDPGCHPLVELEPHGMGTRASAVLLQHEPQETFRVGVSSKPMERRALKPIAEDRIGFVLRSEREFLEPRGELEGVPRLGTV
jgi:hypothetical protein